MRLCLVPPLLPSPPLCVSIFWPSLRTMCASLCCQALCVEGHDVEEEREKQEAEERMNRLLVDMASIKQVSAVLCCAVLCCAVLCCAVLCNLAMCMLRGRRAPFPLLRMCLVLCCVVLLLTQSLASQSQLLRSLLAVHGNGHPGGNGELELSRPPSSAPM
jgi:hypothetical protein